MLFGGIMGRKILIVVLFFASLLLTSCNEDLTPPVDPPKLYQLLEEHKESQDIYMKVKYPTNDNRVILKSEYFESRYFVGLKQFVDLLCNRSYAYIKNDLESDDAIKDYINKHINDQTIYIESHIEEDNVYIYINEDGSLLLKKNNSLYETDKGSVDYNKFCDFEVVDFLQCYDEKEGVCQKLYNNYYYYVNININSAYRYEYWYDNNLDRISFEEAIDAGITPEKYIEYYQAILYRDYFYSFFEDSRYYYALKPPYVTTIRLTNYGLYTQYSIGTFGEYIYEGNFQKGNEFANDILFIQSTNLGSNISKYNNKSGNDYILLGLDYIDYEKMGKFVLTQNEDINKIIDDFKIDHNID